MNEKAPRRKSRVLFLAILKLSNITHKVGKPIMEKIGGRYKKELFRISAKQLSAYYLG